VGRMTGRATAPHVCVLCMLCVLVGATSPAALPSIDGAFGHFWAAKNPQDASKAVQDIVGSGVTFADAFARFKQGRTYDASVKRGTLVQLQRRSVNGDFFYQLVVPASYDPLRQYQVRVQLHGGVMMRETGEAPGRGGRGGRNTGPLEGAEQIYVLPVGWRDAPWWSRSQSENIDAILDQVKRTYNVDENRVVLSGVSDGATGLYYVAMRDSTPFASFLPLNGFMMVLANDQLAVDAEMFPTNLLNKPFFIVNGGQDPLYPTDIVDPHIEQYKKHGVTLVYRPQPDAGHNTRWWPDVKDEFEAFVREHPRKPLPDEVTWETSDASAHNRAHWLVIDVLGATPEDAKKLDDLNEVPISPRPDFGLQSIGGRVVRVSAGSNADRIGFKVGDALVRLNDQTVPFSQDILETLSEVKPGSQIAVIVSRNNKPVELSGVYDPPIVSYPPRQLFDRPEPSGRVDLTRQANTVRASTRGVKAFTLLISPDQFDFNKSVTVVANGRTVFSGRVQKDLRTLLTWAAADNDRTMLFGAEIHVRFQ